MTIIPYNQKLKNRARELRKNSTLGEVLLWNELKQKKVNHLQFLRQKPIQNYIVDFFCKEIKLAIEIDGRSHDTKIKEDIFRQGEIESFGITFLRFTENDVRKNLNEVLKIIKEKISEIQTSPIR